MKYILITFLVSFHLWATCNVGNSYDDSTNAIESFASDIESVIDKTWSAATEDQIQNATCKPKKISIKQMKKYLKKSTSTDKSFDQLVNKEGKFSWSDSIETDLTQYGADSCDNSICKSQKVFGDEMGIKLLYMHQRFGFNGSHLFDRDSRAWKTDEIDSYIKGLQDIPSFMLPIDKDYQFTRSSKASSALANASINFFNGMDELSPLMVQYTTLHELSHYISGHLDVESDPEWLELSHWKEDTVKAKMIKFEVERPKKFSFETSIDEKEPSSSFRAGLTHSKKPSFGSLTNTEPKIGFDVNESIIKTRVMTEAMKNDHKHTIISKYGETNPLEDIAEPIVAYRYNSKQLKEVSPKKYEYIKNKIFQGIEFTEEKKCSSYDEQSLRDKFLSQIKD